MSTRHVSVHFWRSTRAGVSISVAVVAVVLVLIGAAFGFLYLRPAPVAPSCDTPLANQIGMGGNGCLQPLYVTQNANLTEFTVPVLIMQPGGTGTVDILYHVATAKYASHPGLRPTLSATDVPLALSVLLATTNKSQVGFSPGMTLYEGDGWVIFRYTVNAATDATGYYAVLPPYYWGMYPALAVGRTPAKANEPALAMWGYTKCCISGEVTMNSTVVGYAGFTVVDVQVPGVVYCPDAACNIVSQSHY